VKGEDIIRSYHGYCGCRKKSKAKKLSGCHGCRGVGLIVIRDNVPIPKYFGAGQTT
jgi:hypothetical protein